MGREKRMRLIEIILASRAEAGITARLSRDNYNALRVVNTFLVLPRNCNARARIS